VNVSRQTQRGARGVRSFRHWKIASAALVAVIAIWLLWPAPKVTNLDSRGSNVIAFGDSLTAGYGAAAGEDYPSRLSSILGITILNAGTNGDTTETAIARIDSDVVARDPRIVILGLGGNDFLGSVPIATTEANLRSIIHKIQSAGAMVVLLGYRFPSLNANYEKMYERVAKDEGCLLIPNLLHGIETDASLKSDEIHPNARGYQLIAERVAGPCGKLIRRADRAR